MQSSLYLYMWDMKTLEFDPGLRPLVSGELQIAGVCGQAGQLHGRHTGFEAELD